MAISLGLRGLRGLFAVMLLATGCCKQGKFPSGVTGGSGVTRDEFVDTWRVNGDKVCQRVIEAAPGCYVLEVEYSAKYVKRHGGAVFIIYTPMPAPGIVAGLAQLETNTHRARYDSGPIAFAMPIQAGRGYYVTSTFTGDEFLPRVVVTDPSGERVGEILPTRDQQLLATCRNGAPQASRRTLSTCG